MKITELRAVLSKLHACWPALQWIDEFGFENAEQAWCACERGDWMMWLIDAACANWSASAWRASDFAGRRFGGGARREEEERLCADYIRRAVPWDVVLRGLRRVRR